MIDDKEATLALDPSFFIVEYEGSFEVWAGWMGSAMAIRDTEADAWTRAREIATTKHVGYAPRHPPIPIIEPEPADVDPVTGLELTILPS